MSENRVIEALAILAEEYGIVADEELLGSARFLARLLTSRRRSSLVTGPISERAVASVLEEFERPHGVPDRATCEISLLFVVLDDQDERLGQMTDRFGAVFRLGRRVMAEETWSMLCGAWLRGCARSTIVLKTRTIGRTAGVKLAKQIASNSLIPPGDDPRRYVLSMLLV